MSLRPSAKTEVRKNRYKVAFDAEEGRRRREDSMVKIRKNNREQNLLKKRREGLVAQKQPLQQQILSSTADSERKLESLAAMLAGVWSDDRNAQLEATTQFRNMLIVDSPPTNEIIQSGVVPRFVEFLAWDDFLQLQFEAAWVLTNIACESTKVVIYHGAVPMFVKLLESPSDDIREQAVWALGNVAGHSPESRDVVLGHGALIPLLAQFNEHANLSVLRTSAWTLANFCKGKPYPSFEQTKPALLALERLIRSSDEDVLSEACWALSYISDGTNDKIQAVIDAGICPRLVELLLHQSPAVVIPALLTVGNIATGDEIQTQCIIDQQVLPCLLNLLTNKYENIIKRDACWAISSITAGNVNHIQAVIDAGIIAPLVLLLQNSELEIRIEAAWAISNAISGANLEQIEFLIGEGCLILCDLLLCPDPRIVAVCLKAVANILMAGEARKRLGKSRVNLYAQLIDDAGGLEKIEILHGHENKKIYEMAVKLHETYWDEDELNDSFQEVIGERLDGVYDT
ncbi:IMPORTIN ALPHA, IMPORTIN ALPHA ISOFORM 1, importin alpha isoform 1 [Hibiscus trionum]|uniref:Importin subunit alpha n=1 Tax=Hibiscus trionum TaxID=183268 RepID=A0A9W7IT19_HIBTR|nr:IMPORTIN ALPHA, IMPORTIN ALPHA ISOFORM 1, importin alpha isoform 1 [Hibiscus trionum]